MKYSAYMSNYLEKYWGELLLSSQAGEQIQVLNYREDVSVEPFKNSFILSVMKYLWKQNDTYLLRHSFEEK